MADYPTIPTFVTGTTLTADHMTDVYNAIQAIMPVGAYTYLCRAATTVETFVNDCWLECNAVSVLRATYPDLNTLLNSLSYPFGTADGTHMTLPDAQGRVAISMASGGHTNVNAIGDSDGLTKTSRTPKESISVSGGTTSSGGSGTTGSKSADASVGAQTADFAAVGGHSHSIPSHTHTYGGGSATLDGAYLVAGTLFIKAVN